MDAGSYQKVVTSDVTVLCGILKQKRKNGDWNQKHCALWKNYFLCYKDETGIKPQVAFILDGFQVQKSTVENEEFAFQLSKPGVVTHIFATSDETLLNEWIQKLIAVGAHTRKTVVIEEMPLVVIDRNDYVFENSTNVDDAPDNPHFPSLEIETRNLPKLSTEPLRTCLSFDSATAALQATELDAGGQTTLQRSQEIEDLLSWEDERVVTTPEVSKESSTDLKNDYCDDYDDDDDDEGLSFKPMLERRKSLLEEVVETLSTKSSKKVQSEKPDKEDDISSTTNLLAAVSALNAFIRKEKATESKKEISNSNEQMPVLLERSSSKGIPEIVFNDDESADSGVSKTRDSGNRPSKVVNTEFQVLRGKNDGTLSARDEIEKGFTTRNVSSLAPDTPSSNQSLISALGGSIRMSGYLNVSTDPRNEWQRLWTVLSVGQLSFSEMFDSETPIFTVHLKGLQVQPAGWETAKPLAVKLVADDGKPVVLIEPDDVEDLGRWVSGLFRAIQHPNNTVPGNPLLPRASSLTDLSSTRNASLEVAKGMTKSVSTKDVRNVFPTPLTSPTPEDRSSVVSPDYSASSSSSRRLMSPVSDSSLGRLSPTANSTDLLPSDFKKTKTQTMREKLNSKFADVVCWLGRYIEQEQEQEVLSSVANPFLAKLRMRHKLEAVAQLEGKSDKLQRNIETLQQKLEAKEILKKSAGKNTHRGLVRSAEDAKRVDVESKRIDRDCAAIQLQIQKEEKKLSKFRKDIEEIGKEIETEYDQFTWSEENGSHESHSQTNPTRRQRQETVSDDDDNIDGNASLPEWTKKAKQKAKAWKKLGNDLQ